MARRNVSVFSRVDMVEYVCKMEISWEKVNVSSIEPTASLYLEYWSGALGPCRQLLYVSSLPCHSILCILSILVCCDVRTWTWTWAYA